MSLAQEAIVAAALRPRTWPHRPRCGGVVNVGAALERRAAILTEAGTAAAVPVYCTA